MENLLNHPITSSQKLALASNFLRVLPLDIHTLTTYIPSLYTHVYVHVARTPSSQVTH